MGSQATRQNPGSDGRGNKWNLDQVCIVLAAFLNNAWQARSSASQAALRDTIDNIDRNVKMLAGPANTNPKLTPNEILAAAAAKLLDQQKQIDQLQMQESADHSAKQRLRDLLTRVDPRIVAAIDNGQTLLHLHMKTVDFMTLKRILSQSDASRLMTIERGQLLESTSSINCGSENGVCPGRYVDVIISVLPDFKQ